MKVLIVEHNRSIRELMCDWLRDEFPGWTFQVAKTGEEALELAASAQPDIVLMDIELPDMSGFEAARKILIFHATANIIMLAANNEIDYSLEMESSGSAAFLTKRVIVEKLIPVIKGFDCN